MIKSIPCSIESEEALIGTMLQSPMAISVAQSKLRPIDFYSERNRIIYESILAMNNRTIEVNAESFLRYLKENNLLEGVQNDEAYLMRIIDGSSFPQNAVYYVDIIVEKSLLRELIYATQEIQKSAYEASDEQTKEIADYAEKKIFEVTQRRLENDFSTIKELIYEAITMLEQRSLNQNSNNITGIPSGFDGLDKVTHGFQPSDLIILAARPSVGKTSFALNVIENMITNRQTVNFGIGLFSLEMSKMQVAERLLSSKAGINSNKIRTGHFDKEDWHRLGTTFNILSKANLLIDDSSQLTIMQLRGKARQMKYKFMEIKRTTGLDVDLKIIIVDYLQLMHGSHQGKRSFSSREQEVAEISRGLKALAKELNIPIMALAQLSRGVEARQDKPRLSDLRESGSIEQDADLVMFLHRAKPAKKEGENETNETINSNNNEVELIVAKHRNGSILEGLPLTFISSQTRFTNKETDKYQQ